MEKIQPSELILNPDGSVYHLALKPGDLATTIFLVGDPGRVEKVSRHFDTIDLRSRKREFITHTGTLRGKRFSVLSTGIGTDNIDIVINECDAVFNIDVTSRMPKTQLQSLNFIRLGTSGALDASVEVDSCLISAYGIGLDGLQVFYPAMATTNSELLKQALSTSGLQDRFLRNVYCTEASAELLTAFEPVFRKGITLTSPGFYGPQGRSIRLKSKMQDFINTANRFTWDGLRITNFEMETSAIYLLSRLLGHQALSINAIIANRKHGTFSKDPHRTIDGMIQQVMEMV